MSRGKRSFWKLIFPNVSWQKTRLVLEIDIPECLVLEVYILTFLGRIYVATCCSLCYGGLQTRSREFTLVARRAMRVCKRGCADACVEFFLARYSMGVCKQLKKVRSREFTSPLVARCAMGVCKRGRANLRLLLAVLWGFANAVAPTLALNFSWLVILWGFASCWKVRSREFTFQLVAVARERNGKRKRKGD